ncbi:uncharacterized protein MELLADRAFT_114612 [Melampsora larici-populina 98AG31]|uniref:Uncharacterized protein n=1 Tax=Melampsora larici-populina (strain 98AG31 / pathotype 3-4-7) TaxID=747676 RepID=F4SE49_MELLP|nr:uncharacterized protein MELLADRAFT_114612 [Melampsora larici-populina 98AG31]EGF97078.1 hypothetical protein MELLADRAFT_114612 [Melampsora larici-populina 98AG31]
MNIFLPPKPPTAQQYKFNPIVRNRSLPAPVRRCLLLRCRTPFYEPGVIWPTVQGVKIRYKSWNNSVRREDNKPKRSFFSFILETYLDQNSINQLKNFKRRDSKS